MKWDGHKSSQWVKFGCHRALDVVHKGPGVWWWSASSGAVESACGQSETREQAKACAEAVAVAMGWAKAETKPERELVDEWWEVQKDSDSIPAFRSSLGFQSAARARGHRKIAGGVGSIVHVRRYRVKKGKVGS